MAFINHGGYVKRHYLLCTMVSVCAVICLSDYCKNGSIPLLRLLSSGKVHLPILRSICECNCTIKEVFVTTPMNSTDQSSTRDVEFVAQSGQSQIPELVSMDILQESVNFRRDTGLKYLDHLSLSRYYMCKPSKLLLLPNHTSTEKVCKERTFLNRRSPLVALVSFHGSGNTWVRHLVEQATGIFTGSIYCDPGLKVIFPGESVVSGNVVAIKTHQSDTVELPDDIKKFSGKTNFDKVILIVRNPYDALVSEANRRWNSKRSTNDHLGVAVQSAFISNSKWDWLVEYKGAAWAFLLHTWLANKKVPTLVVQYEILIEHTERELIKILEFLNLSNTNNSVKCAVENGSGMFRRTKHLDFNPYSIENCKAMNRYISQAAPILAQYGIKYDHRPSS